MIPLMAPQAVVEAWSRICVPVGARTLQIQHSFRARTSPLQLATEGTVLERGKERVDLGEGV